MFFCLLAFVDFFFQLSLAMFLFSTQNQEPRMFIGMARVKYNSKAFAVTIRKVLKVCLKFSQCEEKLIVDVYSVFEPI